MSRLILNGKFLSAPPTGVHRVAEELIRALDARLAAEGGPEAVLLAPPNAGRALPLSAIRQRRVGLTTWQIWEQAELPLRAGPGLLVNLCNLGPVARANAVTMIHDAQVRETPESYGPAFRAFYRAAQPVIGRRHRRILTVSEHSRQALIRWRVAPEAAIRVIPNGADHVRRTPPDRDAPRALGLRPGGYVLALGSAQAHKNTALLFEAFRDPALAGVPLVLFGMDPPAAIAADPPLNVIWAGRVTDARLFGLMAGAGAFACPSTTEGFGLPPLEAMALGAPVLAAPCGALPETLGPAALYAPPNDPAAWATAVAALLADPAARTERAAAGRARAARFSWSGAAERLLTVVEELEREPAPCPASA